MRFYRAEFGPKKRTCKLILAHQGWDGGIDCASKWRIFFAQNLGYMDFVGMRPTVREAKAAAVEYYEKYFRSEDEH
jgi:hypothetical protein